MSPIRDTSIGRRFKSDAQMLSDHEDSLAEERRIAEKEARWRRVAQPLNRCDGCGRLTEIAGFCHSCDDEQRTAL